MIYPIPSEALDDRLAFVGTAGSGKTYAAGTAVERLLASKARCVIVDPLDVWWGLRLAPDGETASRFNVVIFGGAHGDLPLNEHAGALLGETVAAMAESCIVSLGGLPSKSAERRFMLAFLDAIYRKADPAKFGPFHMVFDEADLFAPQKALEPTLQARMEEIVRRGRVRGFIPWLITQRPAVLSKDVLSQADGLIALKLTASQDRDAIGAWIEGMADRSQGREILGSLPAMQRGQGVVWIPGRGVLATSTFPLKATYDSSRTPKRGEVIRSAILKPLDLGKLKERLASVEAEAKANDPRALKAEIAKLRAEFNKRAIAAPPQPGYTRQEIEDADRAGYARGIDEGFAKGWGRAIIAADEALPSAVAQTLTRLLNEAPSPVGQGRAPEKPQDAPRPRPATIAPPKPAPALATRPAAAEGGNGEDVSLTGPMRRILDALAWWRAFGIEQPTNEQAGFVAGYAPGSGNFNNLKGGLRSQGLIEYPLPGRMTLTAEGAALASVPDIDLTPEAFHRQVRAKLNGPQLKLFDPILGAYPESLSTDEVAEAASYAAGSGNFNNLRGSLRTIGLIDYPAPGKVRAADWLFP